MKKAIALILVLLMAFSVVACDKATTETATTTAPATKTEASGDGKTITLANGTQYPNGTVTIIAPFSAGGSVDLGIRLFAKYAANYTNATIVVENITGGSGLTGIQTGLTRNADGYTMWHIDDGPQYITTDVSSCPFDVMKDMVPIGQMVADDRVFAISPNETRFTTGEEMLQYAKDHPGELTVSTSGSGTIASLIVNYMEALTGAQFNIIAYNGSSEAKAAFLGGHVDVMSAGVSEVANLVADGTGKVILEFAETPVYAGAQSIIALGYKDAVLLSTNRGLAINAKCDPAIINYWSDIMTKVCTNEEYLKEAASMNLVIRHRTSSEFLEQMKVDFATWETIKRAAGL